ncbi:hypothetical protein COB21_00990 [Candidatus Aerophobetes bacterium]|uniref:C4-type zinc ribbon domain-containing protein n=1 Tax=Aerophobetes bacterium TaxID=2030807 RepID=A0A2A4X8R2_UNCAE|nr:MAG: hypothetical protein COB21_00990 [Candidatus Aerophobetes bacterium]
MIREKLTPLLDIQELDMKMIRLMRIKKQRYTELKQIDSLRQDLKQQLETKSQEISLVNEDIKELNTRVETLLEKYKTLEDSQSSIKKIEEFNALTQEMTALEREKASLESQNSILLDKKAEEEDILEKIKQALEDSEKNSQDIEADIAVALKKINAEGAKLLAESERLQENADEEALAVYKRLLRSKKDRVIVPLTQRTCMGCYISNTIQHENMVRKQLGLVFCEHCSRIHYIEDETIDQVQEKPRRRRKTAKASS